MTSQTYISQTYISQIRKHVWQNNWFNLSFAILDFEKHVHERPLKNEYIITGVSKWFWNKAFNLYLYFALQNFILSDEKIS